jgi:hypothetical protein
MLLKPEQRIFLQNGQAKTVHRGSRVTVAVSELATFLGKQQYNTGLVNTLCDLYDCKDKDAHVTIGRGCEPVRDVYATLIAAITPAGLELSIPEEAVGGGLMSRAVTVYQNIPSKIVPIPEPLGGYPVVADLLPKIAWIAHTAKGEYHLSEGALAAYKEWYYGWKRKLFEDFGAHREDEFRRDIILLKLSMLMRVQEYRPGNEITLDNFNSARKLLDFTLARSPEATKNVGASDYIRAKNKVRERIAAVGSISRRVLQQNMSRTVDSETLGRVINDLAIQGFLEIKLDGRTLNETASVGREIYELSGGQDE